MEDDDEFGDLYADVLQRLSSIQNPNPTETLAPSSTGGDQIPIQNPSSDKKPIETLAPMEDGDPKDDWLPDNWNDDDDDDNFPVANFKAKIEPEARFRVSASVEDDGKIGFSQGEGTEMEVLNQEPVIPGLSKVPSSNNSDYRVSNSEDWDSDSEDDLQIVLNDNTHMPIGGERIEDDEDLVIVTGEDQHAMENNAWAEGDLQPSAADGEIKEGSEAAKANGAVGIGGGPPRIGYSNHGVHPQHHSMFKYIRPGAAASGAPAAGTSGQIHLPSTMSSIAGRGRGDWRPGGIPGAPKSFHSGFRPGWANNSSRAFGGGIDFTLPSYKTVFDIDIEIFEEKPWRHPGLDISDYFNFGLDEDSWKEYSKQLDQLRLESTMQSKIRVYESGRSEQAYDPDLPPELAAATGHHVISGDNTNHVKIDNGQSDLTGQGRDASYFQSPFPTGRAIQVESGYGDRLPSVDTRIPRPRDTDVVIEIALQDSIEGTTIYNSAVAQPEKDVQGEELEGVQDVEGDRRSESEYYNRFPQTFNGYRREMGSRRIPHAPERDGSMPPPPESPLHYNSKPRLRSPVSSGGSFGAHHGGRLTEDGASCRQYSTPIANHTKDGLPTCGTHVNRPGDHHIERPGRSMEASHTYEQPPAIAVEMAGDLSMEQKDGEDDGMLALDDGIELEEETSDLRISRETPGDESTIHSSKKPKLSSRVEQPAIRYSGEDDDLRATHSDNSIAKSGSNNQRRRESGDEEVQKVRLKKAGDFRRHHDDYGREGRREMDKMRLGTSGREAMHHSYHRDWEPYSAHPVRGKSEGFERPRETDRPFWQRREDDIHSRRMDEDIRRERKIRVGEGNDKNDDAHLKRLDDGDWRSRNREGGPKLRGRDDVLHRRDNLDDHHAKRKKDEDQLRRERTEKDESSRRKRERDDNPNNRKREDSSRMREKVDEHHSSKHKDESWHLREREDRQRLKHPHEDPLLHRERTQGRGATRSGRTTDDKALGGSGRNKSDSKVMVSDKDNQHRDKRHYKGREDAYACEKNYNNEERSSRHEKLRVHSSCPNVSDSQQISRERQREGTRRIKDIEIDMHNPTGLGKRKHEDRSARHLEKVSSKGVNEQESSKPPHSSDKQGEKDIASGDEGQHESKRGRSKMERWTSHKEREYNDLDIKDIEGATKDITPTSDITPTDELPKTEGNDASDSDRHLDTVEKLKRRSERFKLPMPVDKDVASLSKRSENEALAENEVKPERPARKRRWTTS